MQIRDLIDKYGETVLVDGVGMRAFVESDILGRTALKMLSGYTGFKGCVLCFKQVISKYSKVVFYGESYFVLRVDLIKNGGIVIYSKATLLLDDFFNDIEVRSQALEAQGVNLPSFDAEEVRTAKARIKTIKPQDYKELAMHGGKIATHIITVLHGTILVSVSDSIKWKDREFEILSIENVDERDRILNIYVIEVLTSG